MTLRYIFGRTDSSQKFVGYVGNGEKCVCFDSQVSSRLQRCTINYTEESWKGNRWMHKKNDKFTFSALILGVLGRSNLKYKASIYIYIYISGI